MNYVAKQRITAEGRITHEVQITAKPNYGAQRQITHEVQITRSE